MGSHYDCENQHNLGQFNLLNVQQCTEAPSNIQHANVKAHGMLDKRLSELKLINVLLTPERKERFVSKAPLNIDVLIELYGNMTQWYSLLPLIPSSAKTLSSILMVQITKY